MTQKQVSQLDASGHFVGLTSADESPLEPGVWLLPAGTIEFIPPAIPPDSVARWDGSRFVIEAVEREADLPVVPPSPAELQAQYTALLDVHLDSTAQARGFDNRITCAMRAGYPGPFQADGAAFGQWMDACYLAGRQVMADVMAGARPMPTPEEFLAELPPMVWPEGPM